MKIREILNDENNETVEKILWMIAGSTYDAEIEVINVLAPNWTGHDRPDFV